MAARALVLGDSGRYIELDVPTITHMERDGMVSFSPILWGGELSDAHVYVIEKEWFKKRSEQGFPRDPLARLRLLAGCGFIREGQIESWPVPVGNRLSA